MKKPETNWRWGTPEGGREFDRLMDARLSFREKIQWIEETEALHERLAEKTAGCLSKDMGDRHSLSGD